MERMICGIEDHAAIQYRRYAFFAARHAGVPQFQDAAPFVLPAFVQVQQHIDATIEFAAFISVEVGVDIEFAAWQDLVERAAKKMRIGNDSFYPRELFQEIEKYMIVEQQHHVVREARYASEIVFLQARLLENLMGIVAALEAFEIARWEFVCQSEGYFIWQQIVDHCMWER